MARVIAMMKLSAKDLLPEPLDRGQALPVCAAQ